MTKNEPVNYQDLNRQLEEVLAKLQQSDIQIDEAVRLYEQGLTLITEIEAHLKKAENNIERLKLKVASNG